MIIFTQSYKIKKMPFIEINNYIFWVNQMMINVTGGRFIPGDPKKLHELDRSYFLESKCYENKQGISM